MLSAMLSPLYLILPQSITYTISSIVIDVSAIFVAIMIFRIPVGGLWKILCCSKEGSRECRGYTSNFDFGNSQLCSITDMSLVISPIPGRNTRTAPGSLLLINLRTSTIKSILISSILASSNVVHTSQPILPFTVSSHGPV